MSDSQNYLVSPPLSQSISQPKYPLQLGILASGNGSNFEAIASAIDSGKLNAKILVVVYNKAEAKVKERASKRKIPAILINHRQFATREAFDSEIVKVLQQHQVQWVVMAGWMRIVTNVFLAAFPERIINIHPSLLPSFPGIRAIEQALEAKVKITGCTVHIATLPVDSGPIIMQAAVPILPEDTPETLHKRIQQQEHRILPEAIAICASQIN